MKDDNTSYIKYMKVSNYDLVSRIQTQENYDKQNITFIKHYARFCLSRFHVNILLDNDIRRQLTHDFFSSCITHN